MQGVVNSIHRQIPDTMKGVVAPSRQKTMPGARYLPCGDLQEASPKSEYQNWVQCCILQSAPIE